LCPASPSTFLTIIRNSLLLPRMRPALSHLPEVLRVPRTDAVYNCHPYITKVPIGAILPFIEALTDPGETVLDPFAGSGMTGVAAIKAGRRAWMSDISVLGQHIAGGYLCRVQASELREAGKEVIVAARKALGQYYQVQRACDGAQTEFVRTIWSFSYVCAECRFQLVYYHHLDSHDRAPGSCPSCGRPFVRREWARGPDLPVEVVVRDSKGRLRGQPVTERDLECVIEASLDERQSQIPSLPIDAHREMFSRSGLRKAGLHQTKDFFSPRNALALVELWHALERVGPGQLRKKLQFCFTAMLARASRRYQWSRKTPLNAQNQTYYIAPIYYEWNVFELFARKVEAAIRSDELVFRSPDLLAGSTSLRFGEEVTYTLASASRLNHIKTGSVQYVFTDPPFGSNIFYSDMSLFHEAWLGMQTDPSDEAVVHTTGKRKETAAKRYENLLCAAFLEAYRVLIPSGCMSVVFGNSSGLMWGILQRALASSGFNPTPVHACVLDKGQRSVKGLASGVEGVATVDLILTVVKQDADNPGALKEPKPNVRALICEGVEELKSGRACSASHLYADVLRKAITFGISLDDIHLSDILAALRTAGYIPDTATGKLKSDFECVA
jgi:16S rRNA G966 N2-methylase RsmD